VGVVSTLGVGALTRVSATVSVLEFSQRRAAADLIVDHLREPLLAWIEEFEADPVAVPPNGLMEILSADLDGVYVRVEALDCSGRLHVEQLQTFARMGLPASLQRIDDREIAWRSAALRRAGLSLTLDEIAALVAPSRPLKSGA